MSKKGFSDEQSPTPGRHDRPGTAGYSEVDADSRCDRCSIDSFDADSCGCFIGSGMGDYGLSRIRSSLDGIDIRSVTMGASRACTTGSEPKKNLVNRCDLANASAVPVTRIPSGPCWNEAAIVQLDRVMGALQLLIEELRYLRTDRHGCDVEVMSESLLYQAVRDIYNQMHPPILHRLDDLQKEYLKLLSLYRRKG